ncbi:TCR/Tet family MFS transporter [Sandaracinobacter sp. RS1-74]|uniref:TCR/Tet family MFS transporter n=1 Tax=Sandaracinobacteroides sayramensis TaxID=2913411 RepID=UPI001ED9D0DB|nr:TCR/Tet family MFS transporter [Sandaracinobacteroides sayramensis]MCG2840254.1 TCR/Tet family MFS transporter [Sandaracinobacteroides sayramensis]
MTGAEGAPSIPRGPLAFILLTVLMDVIGFGLIVPVLPTLVSELGHVGLSDAAGIGGWIIMSYALAQFIFSPVLGGLSDAYGRRPVLLISMGGFAVNMLITAFAPVLWLLFVGRILAGITGASIATANAYIADITPPQRRAQTFGLLGVAFGLGFALGPAIGGLIGALDPRWPFLVAAAMAGCNMLMGIFLLPESLPPERRRPFDWRRANLVGSLRQLGRLGGKLRRLALVYFLWMLALQSLHGIWSYIAAYRYGWTPFGIGLSLTFVGVLAILVNGLFVRRSVKWLGEWRTALLGIAGGTLAYIVYFFADRPELAYAGLTIGAIGGLTVPALQALMTENAPPNAQGELQGALATLSSLTIILGPLLFARVFTHFSGEDAAVHAPGMPFLLSVLLASAALLLLLWNRPGRERLAE